MNNAELENLLKTHKLNFYWNESQQMWWLKGMGVTTKNWHSGYNEAQSQEQAQKAAIEYIKVHMEVN